MHEYEKKKHKKEWLNCTVKNFEDLLKILVNDDNLDHSFIGQKICQCLS